MPAGSLTMPLSDVVVPPPHCTLLANRDSCTASRPRCRRRRDRTDPGRRSTVRRRLRSDRRRSSLATIHTRSRSRGRRRRIPDRADCHDDCSITSSTRRPRLARGRTWRPPNRPPSTPCHRRLPRPHRAAPANAQPRPARRSRHARRRSSGRCALAAAVAIPAAAFVSAPIGAKGAEGRWVRTLRLDQLVDGEPKRVAIVDDRRDAWTIERGVELGSVWLVKHGDEVSAFSAVVSAPRLLGERASAATGGGAPSGFACPCHTSAFDADGKRTQRPVAARPRRARHAGRRRGRRRRLPALSRSESPEKVEA